jgi:gamma-glutamyl hercynylcysteine S-oxide synthase
MSAIRFESTDPRSTVAALLAEARERTLLLVRDLSDADLLTQHDPLMSPILWDLGHIAHFEELWLTQNLDGTIEFSEMPGMYNPFEHPRATRANLPLPALGPMLERMSDIRERVLARLERTEFDTANPLLAGGYVYNMVLQHEYQHNETILQTLQLKLGEPYHPPRRFSVPEMTRDEESRPEMVEIPAGEYTIGTEDRTSAYDNERPRHLIQVAGYRIDRTPVTNGDFLEFIRDGGYTNSRLWSDAGLKWLNDSGAAAPKYWARADTEWTVRTMYGVSPVDSRRPVCHVCYHEAEAFARWAGKRLPTEFEWEIAAGWDPERGKALRFPWGDDDATSDRANVDQLSFATAPVGAYPRNISPFGCYGMIGDVWEWTSSDFSGYPGFESFPYREYSEEFFGTEYKVLRGGSWATRPGAIRNSFRNWDFPIRRQIFSGLRCASDV